MGMDSENEGRDPAFPWQSRAFAVLKEESWFWHFYQQQLDSSVSQVQVIMGKASLKFWEPELWNMSRPSRNLYFRPAPSLASVSSGPLCSPSASLSKAQSTHTLHTHLSAHWELGIQAPVPIPELHASGIEDV